MEPVLCRVIGGLPLSGKNKLAKAIIARCPDILWIDIDDVAEPPQADAYVGGVRNQKDKDRMDRAYAKQRGLVNESIARGQPVIATATFSKVENRQLIESNVLTAGGQVMFIRCVFNDTPQEVQSRIEERRKSGGPGHCTNWEHYKENRDGFADFQGPHLVIQMDRGIPINLHVTRVLEYKAA